MQFAWHCLLGRWLCPPPDWVMRSLRVRPWPKAKLRESGVQLR